MPLLTGIEVTNIRTQIYTFVWALTHKPRNAFPSELKYKTNDGIQLHEFQPKELELSVVIPCFNETERLKLMLDEAIQHLDSSLGQTNYEIIIVDDGSSDNTAEYALELATKEFKIIPHTFKVIKLEHNRGKGGAVTHGMLMARGKYVIFADADGATKFSDIDKLIKGIKLLDKNEPLTNSAISIGSRAHMVSTDAVVKRSPIRNFLMYGLHTLVYIFGIRDIKDTQCGFKMFNRASIEIIMPNMHTEGWIFDVEVLILAHRNKIPIDEIPVNWHEVDGSKMVLARDSVNMAIDLVITRLAYVLGIYKERRKTV